jgi:hypothetical protein
MSPSSYAALYSVPSVSALTRQKLHISGPIGARSLHVTPPSVDVVRTVIESTPESRDDVTGNRVIALSASAPVAST